MEEVEEVEGQQQAEMRAVMESKRRANERAKIELERLKRQMQGKEEAMEEEEDEDDIIETSCRSTAAASYRPRRAVALSTAATLPRAPAARSPVDGQRMAAGSAAAAAATSRAYWSSGPLPALSRGPRPSTATTPKRRSSSSTSSSSHTAPLPTTPASSRIQAVTEILLPSPRLPPHRHALRRPPFNSLVVEYSRRMISRRSHHRHRLIHRLARAMAADGARSSGRLQRQRLDSLWTMTMTRRRRGEAEASR